MDKRTEIGLNKELILKFKCVEDSNNDGYRNNGCNECALFGTSICTKLVCVDSQRSDNKDVHFEFIDE